MNALVAGLNQQPILKYVPRQQFLFLNDGSFTVDRRAKVFDPTKHRFNILKDITPRKARELALAFYNADPGGDATLTVRNGKRALARLLKDAERLDRLSGDRKDLAIAEALAMIDDVLFDPLIKDILCKPANFSLNGTIIANLNPSEIGENACHLIGNLLIIMYKHQVIVPNYGMYANPAHTALLRENRLVAGLTTLAEAPERLRERLLLVEERVGSRCISDDAETLALYAGKARGTDGFSTFAQNAMK